MTAPAAPVAMPDGDAADGPAFDEPWQAQAFSIVVHLHRQGRFTWSEWVAIFSDEIKASPQQPGESVNAAYYRQWLAAMETLVDRLSLVTPGQIDLRSQEWRQAYLNTPHGEAVALAHAACPPAHAHSHAARRTPVAVSVGAP